VRGLLPYRGVSGDWLGPRDCADDARPWWLRAACRGVPGALFFPEGQRRHLGAMDAQEVCRRCEVRDECLADAEAHGEVFGVWGGVDFEGAELARQRERSRRQQDRGREPGEAA
jgi:WhiB family redox-sensing transcriptional regulator